jgi:Tol biopolymer transport system component
LSVPANPNSFLLVQLKQFNNLFAGPADDFGKAKQITFATFNLLSGNFVFDWLPNNKIVYASSQTRGLNLWTMDADGNNARELTPPGNDDGFPAASADGRYIVFSSRRSGSEQIWRIDADGTHAKQLTTCASNSQPSVSPDGNWVVYVSGCDGTGALWRIPIEGGQPERLTEKAAAWPWISPDGKWIACGYESSPNKWQLAIVPIEGGSPAKLFDVAPLAVFNFAVRWMPDGKAVTYRESSKGLWRQPIEGGKPEQIPNLPEDKIYCYGWSRDGKLFAFSRGLEIRDAVLFRNAQ